MLELYMKLFEARSVNFEAKGGGSGIWRDEVLGAAALATKAHPTGNRIILAEMGDEHSLRSLDTMIRCLMPTQPNELMAVLMGRPLESQLESMIYQSPRYKRESRRAAVIREKGKHLSMSGKVKDGAAKKLEAQAVIDAAKARVREEILRTGKCPSCRGTGVRERKADTCQVCHGSGGVHADVAELRKRLTPAVYKQFIGLAEKLAIERQEWINVFMRQIQRERAA